MFSRVAATTAAHGSSCFAGHEWKSGSLCHILRARDFTFAEQQRRKYGSKKVKMKFQRAPSEPYKGGCFIRVRRTRGLPRAARASGRKCTGGG